MATTLEIIRGISQAAANGYDGARDENGEPISIGLKREEGNPIIDSRVMDGFNCRMHGDLLCLTYQSEIHLRDVHDKNFESDIEQTIQVFIIANKDYKIGNLGDVDPVKGDAKDSIDAKFKSFLEQGGLGSRPDNDKRKE